MKSLLLVFVCFALSLTAFAQNPTQIFAAGVSFNNSAKPAIAGTALYAHALTDGSGTYGFTVIDALPQTVHPFTVTTNISAGFAQKLFSVGSTAFYVPTAAGVSFTGSNTGWNWSTGLLVPVKLKDAWRMYPNVRVIKSSVSGGTGYQPVVGILLGRAQ